MDDKTQEKLDAMSAQLDEHNTQIKNLQASHDAMKAQLNAPKTGSVSVETKSKVVPVPSGTFTHASKKYGFLLSALNVPGKGLITAEEILKDEELQELVVSNGYGIVKEIV